MNRASSLISGWTLLVFDVRNDGSDDPTVSSSSAVRIWRHMRCGTANDNFSEHHRKKHQPRRTVLATKDRATGMGRQRIGGLVIGVLCVVLAACADADDGDTAAPEFTSPSSTGTAVETTDEADGGVDEARAGDQAEAEFIGCFTTPPEAPRAVVEIIGNSDEGGGDLATSPREVFLYQPTDPRATFRVLQDPTLEPDGSFVTMMFDPTVPGSQMEEVSGRFALSAMTITTARSSLELIAVDCDLLDQTPTEALIAFGTRSFDPVIFELDQARCESTADGMVFAHAIDVDCAIPFAEGTTPPPIPFDVYLTGPTGELIGEPDPCEVHSDPIPGGIFDEGPVLYCKDVGDPLWEPGELSLTLGTGGGEVDEAFITRTPPDSFENPLPIGGQSGTAVSADRLLSVRFGDDPTNLHIIVRARGTGEEMARLSADRAERTEDTFGDPEYLLDVDLPDGRYRWWPCIGAAATDCDELPGGFAFEVVDVALEELVPGHNSDTDARINVVFLSSGIESDRWSPETIGTAEIARSMLGDLNTDLAGALQRSVDPREALGPATIEPLASNMDHFNFWFVDQPVASANAYGELIPRGPGFGLPNTAITVLAGERYKPTVVLPGPPFLSEAEVAAGDLERFGYTTIAVSPNSFQRLGSVLAHEWGHALFGLHDEYPRENLEPGGSADVYNCATSESAATERWGEWLGQIDPFAEELADLAPDGSLDFRSAVRIEITAGGCEEPSDSDQVFRPSSASLMSDVSIPVFGSVNRARIETVLELIAER